MTQEHLTSDNFPTFLIGKILNDKDFEFVDDVELIKGKSIIINKAGRLYLYMGDDCRRDKPIQIIVKEICSFELSFLNIESKKGIRLTHCKFV